jgi:hypothetical protein
MIEQERPLEDIRHIKRMMEQSSRFISLSGLSGIAAGVCALVGAWLAGKELKCWMNGDCDAGALFGLEGVRVLNNLLWIATLTFAGAFLSAFFFTWLRSKKNNLPLWSAATGRLFWNTTIPMAVGGIFIIRMMQLGQYELIAPACLLFYGLALVNASKYTLGEVRYLGYSQLALGLMSLWYIGYGLYFWAMGFGIMHIAYGAWMWNKYEKNS